MHLKCPQVVRWNCCKINCSYRTIKHAPVNSLCLEILRTKRSHQKIQHLYNIIRQLNPKPVRRCVFCRPEFQDVYYLGRRRKGNGGCALVTSEVFSHSWGWLGGCGGLQYYQESAFKLAVSTDEFTHLRVLVRSHINTQIHR